MAIIVAGVDGCKAGWFAVLWNVTKNTFTCRVVPDICAVCNFAAEAKIIAVDIPIGLPDHANPGGRECDSLARKLLGPKRASSVFSPPARAVLECTTYEDAVNANRDSSDHALGLSKQCFAILPKIREVERFITIELQQTLFEIHPELCFLSMNKGQKLHYRKQSPEGLAERKHTLAQNGFDAIITQALSSHTPGAAQDDILDACAACWTARRIALCLATPLPPSPPSRCPRHPHGNVVLNSWPFPTNALPHFFPHRSPLIPHPSSFSLLS